VENPSGPRIFFFERLLLLQFHCVLYICLGNLYPLGSFLDSYVYVEICRFLLEFSIYLNIGFQNSPSDFSGFPGASSFLILLI
jgi:hypothetical protein